MKIDGSVALVTGAASGLGLATATRFVERGGKVVIADLTSSPGAERAKALGGSAVFVATDVTDEASVQAAVDAASRLGRLDIVVNCAGIVNGFRVTTKRGPFPLDAFERVIAINLVGTFNVIRLAATRMVEDPTSDEERGVIINTASVAAYEGQIGQAAYSASKAGVLGLTLPIARDLAEHKIRVMTIAPGLFHTPMFDSLPAKSIEALARSTPHPRRLGAPEEYAALAQHIVENPMLNGETIRLDGAVRLEPR